MFSSLAHRYDRANHWLSLKQDSRWRTALVRWANPQTGERILDLCTGTGDLAMRFAQQRQVQVTGMDIADKMLTVARNKAQRAGLSNQIRYDLGNALDLPYSQNTFDIVSIAFGLRNLPEYTKGLLEAHRVLKPGGRFFILEFSRPQGLWGHLYMGYLRFLLPALGGWITGQKAPYQYLNESIRQFPARQDLSDLLLEVGFKQPRVKSFWGGVALIHRVEKPA